MFIWVAIKRDIPHNISNNLILVQTQSQKQTLQALLITMALARALAAVIRNYSELSLSPLIFLPNTTLLSIYHSGPRFSDYPNRGPEFIPVRRWQPHQQHYSHWCNSIFFSLEIVCFGFLYSLTFISFLYFCTSSGNFL